MSVKVDQNSGTIGRPGELSGVVVHVLIGLAHAHEGEGGVARALALAGEGRSFTTLGDVGVWSSVEEIVALFNAVALVTGDGAIGLHVGGQLLTTPDGSDFVDRLRALGSPEVAFKHIEPVVRHFDATCDAVTLEVAADHALVRVRPVSTVRRHAHLCEMTRGLLAKVPALYGMGPAIITEAECAARGGHECLYAVSWEHVDEGNADDGDWGSGGNETQWSNSEAVQPSPTRERQPDPPAERRESERDTTGWSERATSEFRDGMDELLEGALSFASEIVTDDAQAILSKIAARADSVVRSHRYLLMLGVPPEAPIQLYYRGLEPNEAQVLATQLWDEDPDDGGLADDVDDPLLIVDITTPERRYGLLAELPDVGVVRQPTEPALLRAFAEYAAAGLDIFRVVAEARQSNATARTLLAFAESLSRVTTVPDLLQLLADTVPSMTNCDWADVRLWDPELGRLVEQTTTEGVRRPDASVAAMLSGSSKIRAFPPPHADRVGVGSDTRPKAVPSDSLLVEHVVRARGIFVIDNSTNDLGLRELLDGSGAVAAVVAPLFAGDEFLGIVSANFGPAGAVGTVHDANLHERLSGLADQAATTLQNLTLMDEISHMAWYDSLTGLPNRRLFRDRVEQELVRSRRVGEPVCLFFVDLDRFKSVNDTKGHAAGDDLIQQVSGRLLDTVRRQDTVARVGGDEFAILLPGLSDQLAIDQLARRSLEAASRPFLVLGDEVTTSASIGIAMAPEHGDTYDELLNHADEAMYRAKRRGSNRFEMYSRVGTSTEAATVDDRLLQADLLHALDRQELFVVYQPFVDLRTSRVIGVEALVRWNHPIYGILSPASFIPLAEESGLIVAIDTWVIEDVCGQLRRWLDAGLDPLTISVNLSSSDLADPTLFTSISRSLEATRIDPSLLELEVTEQAVLERTGETKENIERLRRLGVQFAIDDFGTGSGSLRGIGSFPVSTLKIDQSFVQIIGADDDHNSLVSAIISMAERLGLNCVAEGVETRHQSQLLLQRGCTTAQGYFLSPPLPAEEIERLIVESNQAARGDATG
jgi:diguanylate cyclase (GGDEF)-like protein